MKRLIYIIVCAFAGVSIVSCSGNLGARVDQYANVGIPVPITVKSVRSIPGGAVIKVTIPDDPNLKGVVAEYKRGGMVVNSKISRYVDSLTVEGFADTEKHTVTLYSFNVNEERSKGVDVDIQPLKPAIREVVASMKESFGGVKVHIQNNTSKSDLAVCLLRDGDLSDLGKPVSEMKWVEVTTMFTASEDIFLSRRGIEPQEAIFGMYLRDHWGNMSDTTVAVLTPIVESKLDTVRYNGNLHYKFSDAQIADDICISQNSSSYPVSALWDGSGLSKTPYFFVSQEVDGYSPTWLTIDLGNMACLSRITTLPRIDYDVYAGGNVRDYEFWGSPGELQPDGTYKKPTGKKVDPTEDNPYGFDPDVWFCLGSFTTFKPTGYLSNGLPGDVTQEDRNAFNAGNDFELDPSKYPHCNDPIRYFRIIFVNTYITFEYGHDTKNRSVQTGEVTPYGRPIFE